MTGQCFVVDSSCARPGVVTATGDSILVCASRQDVTLLESLEVGWKYRLYGRVVETLAEWNGARITDSLPPIAGWSDAKPGTGERNQNSALAADSTAGLLG
jgi:hypothetical protein